eukprot:scaffold11235_cov98-Isochrysis_galbana.AAC.2
MPFAPWATPDTAKAGGARTCRPMNSSSPGIRTPTPPAMPAVPPPPAASAFCSLSARVSGCPPAFRCANATITRPRIGARRSIWGLRHHPGWLAPPPGNAGTGMMCCNHRRRSGAPPASPAMPPAAASAPCAIPAGMLWRGESDITQPTVSQLDRKQNSSSGRRSALDGSWTAAAGSWTATDGSRFAAAGIWLFTAAGVPAAAATPRGAASPCREAGPVLFWPEWATADGFAADAVSIKSTSAPPAPCDTPSSATVCISAIPSAPGKPPAPPPAPPPPCCLRGDSVAQSTPPCARHLAMRAASSAYAPSVLSSGRRSPPAATRGAPLDATGAGRGRDPLGDSSGQIDEGLDRRATLECRVVAAPLGESLLDQRRPRAAAVRLRRRSAAEDGHTRRVAGQKRIDLHGLPPVVAPQPESDATLADQPVRVREELASSRRLARRQSRQWREEPAVAQSALLHAAGRKRGSRRRQTCAREEGVEAPPAAGLGDALAHRRRRWREGRVLPHALAVGFATLCFFLEPGFCFGSRAAAGDVRCDPSRNYGGRRRRAPGEAAAGGLSSARRRASRLVQPRRLGPVRLGQAARDAAHRPARPAALGGL